MSAVQASSPALLERFGGDGAFAGADVFFRSDRVLAFCVCGSVACVISRVWRVCAGFFLCEYGFDARAGNAVSENRRCRRRVVGAADDGVPAREMGALPSVGFGKRWSLNDPSLLSRDTLSQRSEEASRVRRAATSGCRGTRRSARTSATCSKWSTLCRL